MATTPTPPTAPRTLLKVLIDQRHWRYVDFVRIYERTARDLAAQTGRTALRGLTVSEAQYRRWTAGKVATLPGADACSVRERIFGVGPEALFAAPGAGADHYRHPHPHPAADGGSAALSGNPGRPPFPGRPALCTSTPPDLESDLAMTSRDAAEQAGAIAALVVSDLSVDQLRDDVSALARTYNRLSPFDVYREAKVFRHQAETMRERTRVPVQQSELLVLAGQSCALLGTAAFDLGAMDDAIRLFRSAALYAETARFDPLRAFAGGSLATCAYFTGRPAEALRLVRAAQTFGGLGDIARSRLYAIEARSHGHLGSVERAQRALRASLEAGEAVGSPNAGRDELHDDVGGEFGFTAERLAMSGGTTCLLIGDGSGAEQAAIHALDLVESRPLALQSPPVFAKAAADLAHARLLRGHLEGAAEAMETVWQLPRDHRVTGVLERTGQVRSALTSASFRQSPLAAELGERIEEFGSFAAPPDRLGIGA
jgi:hypothetical protein